MPCISTDTYMQAGGPEVFPGLELVAPIAVSCWSGMENKAGMDPKSRVAGLEQMVDMLNEQLCRKAEAKGVTHIFSVKYSSAIAGRGAVKTVQYKAIGNGYRQKMIRQVGPG